MNFVQLPIGSSSLNATFMMSVGISRSGSMAETSNTSGATKLRKRPALENSTGALNTASPRTRWGRSAAYIALRVPPWQ